MKVSKIQFSSFPKYNFPNPEVKEYVHGDYVLIIENYPTKQIRTIRNIKRCETISREVVFYN